MMGPSAILQVRADELVESASVRERRPPIRQARVTERRHTRKSAASASASALAITGGSAGLYGCATPRTLPSVDVGARTGYPNAAGRVPQAIFGG